MANANQQSPSRANAGSPSGRRSTPGSGGSRRSNGGGSGGSGGNRGNTNDPLRQAPRLPPYFPELLVIYTVVVGWNQEALVYAAMDLLASAYALLAVNRQADAREVWRIMQMVIPTERIDEKLQGYQAYYSAAQNGGISSHIPASTSDLQNDAIVHMSWAWRRLTVINRDAAAGALERVGMEVFGANRWAQETAARAQSPSAE